jgi:hypothetical protein
MQEAAYGMYRDGQIIFDEPDVNINNSRVLVVFLDKESAKITDFFDLRGPWEDTRDVETIISDIRNRKDCNNDLQIINEKSAMLNKEAEDVLIYQENI